MTEPSFNELEQLIYLARAYTENCMASPTITNGTRSGGIVVKAEDWLKALQKMSVSRKVELALETLAANGVILDHWPATAKVMEISTCHVSEETAKTLEIEAANSGGTLELVVYGKGEHGWWIFVPDDDMMPETIPEELAACLNTPGRPDASGSASTAMPMCSTSWRNSRGDRCNQLQIFLHPSRPELR